MEEVKEFELQPIIQRESINEKIPVSTNMYPSKIFAVTGNEENLMV